VLHDFVDRLHPGRPRQLEELGELLGLTSGREHRDGEPALGLGAGRRVGLPGRHRWIMREAGPGEGLRCVLDPVVG